MLREHASDYRAYAGRVNAGSISVGDEILAPYGRKTTVAGIDSTDGPVETAHAGDSVALRLADEIDLTRGDLLASGTRPEDTREFAATVVGLTEKELRAGQAVKLRIGTAFVRARVASVDRVLDIDGAAGDNTSPEAVALNEIAHVTIQTADELPVEPYAARGAVGNFLLVDQSSGNTLAAGLVGKRLR